MALFGGVLYAGGSFDTAGDARVNGIARWDGTARTALPGASEVGVDGGDPLAMAVFDDGSGPALYVGGTFLSAAGGVTANRIARWDGTARSGLAGPAGTGMNETVSALAVYDDGTGAALYAGDHFHAAGSMASRYLASWTCDATAILTDGFELGNLSRWTASIP